MNLRIKEDTDWSKEEKAQVVAFISTPAFNGGYSLPDGATLADVFDALPTRSLAVWKDEDVALCLSLAPIDTRLKTGLFHVAGDGQLPAGSASKIAGSWLTKQAQGGYSVRAFTPSKAVMRWGQRLGFQLWGRDPGTGDYVGAFPLHT